MARPRKAAKSGKDDETSTVTASTGWIVYGESRKEFIERVAVQLISQLYTCEAAGNVYKRADVPGLMVERATALADALGKEK